MKSLKGKVALVTGGSQGLGREIGSVLSRSGVRVYLGDVKYESALITAEGLQKNRSVVRALAMDVSDEQSVSGAIGEIISQEGTLDIVVNNAGIDITKSIEELTAEEWLRVIAVNLTGPFLVTKFAQPHLARSRGHVVNITSTAAKRAWENASAYHASKWGLLGLSYAMFVENRKKNVKTTAIVAGGMKTPFILERFPEAEENLQDPANVAEVVRYVLLTPDESNIPEVMVIPMRETSWP